MATPTAASAVANVLSTFQQIEQLSAYFTNKMAETMRSEIASMLKGIERSVRAPTLDFYENKLNLTC